MVALSEVFGISARVDSASYVDRGGLDETFHRALRSDRHIVVHGGSKQGKSWLRTRGLPGDETLLVQCTPAATAASLIGEALGRLGVNATLSQSDSRELSGSLDFSGAGELGYLVAKLKLEGGVTGSISTTTSTQVEPIGRTSADLLWVCLSIVASGKKLVFEDFHYLSEAVQREIAFMMKAMGEYGLYLVLVGVWPRDHMLTYFNGDLDGRVEDIHLNWDDSELAMVLSRGSGALRVHIATAIEQQMIRDAYGSVGLLQRLAERFCLVEGVAQTSTSYRARELVSGSKYLEARTAVATEMQGRYQTFADDFVRGMRRLSEGLEVYRYILEVVTEATDSELLDGIDSALLLQRMLDRSGPQTIRQSDLTQALERIDRLQVKIGVNPLVLTYHRTRRRLFLADRSLLFYRLYGNPRWPWAEGEPEIHNDLYTMEPLDLEFD